MDRMTQLRITDAVETAVITGCDFVFVYHDTWGQHIDFGNRMSRPVPNSILFNRWEGTHFNTSGLLYLTEIVALWTEHDYCSCGLMHINLDNRDGVEPLCDVCAREGYESARGDALQDDGGF